MLHLINNLPATSKHRIVLPRLTYVRNGLNENLNKVITYNRHYPQYLSTDHLLMRLMYHAPLASLDAEPRRLLDICKDIIPSVSTALQITSETREGRSHNPGPFYGLGINEIVVLFSEDFDINDDWRELRPIEPWYHPYTQVSLQIPDGTKRGEHDGGHSVVGINFPMLVWMFKCWLDSEESWMTSDQRYNLSHFLKMWVLPNMLHRHQDIVVFNRLRYIALDKEMEKDRYKHSFFTIDYRDALDANLRAWDERVRLNTLDFNEVLSTIPLLQATGQETFDLPKLFLSRAIRWSLLTARLPLFMFLLGYDGLNNNKRNMGEKRRIYGEIRRMLRDKNYEGGFDRMERLTMKSKLEELMKRLL